MPPLRLRLWTVHLPILALLLLCSWGCGGGLAVQKATQQDRIAGVEGADILTVYAATLTKPKALHISIDSIWVGDRVEGRWTKPQVTFPGIELAGWNNLAPRGVNTLSLDFRVSRPGAPPRRPGADIRPSTPLETAPKHLPEGFRQGAVLYWTVKGKFGTFIISEFEKLATEYYP